jgi:hypothetical protein
MANIKLFGNTKIQGKAFFALSEPEPTYSIEKSVSSVDEGASVTFTLTTTNVANGTEVPYTITGISATDITSGSLTGNFTVNSNTATVTITATADQLTEGAETATLTLDNVADFDSVTVNDTSLTPSFSPTDIAGLVGWYDATEGVYNTNQNDATDDQYAPVSFTAVTGLGSASGVVSYSPNFDLLNGKNAYGSNGNNYLRWENNTWTLTYEIGRDEENGSDFRTITASGDTQYPWQANWSGTGNSITRNTTANSVLATNGQTVAKWKNKIQNLSNATGGHMIQTVLAQQPLLVGGYVSFYSHRLSANFGRATSAARTYYFVGRSAGNSNSNLPILASSSNTFTTQIRGGLIHKSFREIPRYGLNQGTSSNTTAVYSTFEGNEYRTDIICASFESAGSGKIKMNNLNEQTLNSIGNQFSSASDYLFAGSTQFGNSFKAKEILFFEGAHTTEQKTQVINYLNAKYNLF